MNSDTDEDVTKNNGNNFKRECEVWARAWSDQSALDMADSLAALLASLPSLPEK